MLNRLRKVAFVSAFLGAISAPALAAQPAPIAQVPATKPGKRGLFNDMVLPSGRSLVGRKGAGISMAQQQRTATKKRNRARHRAHCK